jgi:tetratricopeptide (TPR) repeat protein
MTSRGIAMPAPAARAVRIWKSGKNVKELVSMMSKYFQRALFFIGILFIFTALVHAQAGSTRPRRAPQAKPSPTPQGGQSSSQGANDPLLDPTPAKNTGAVAPVAPVVTGSTALAYSLLKQEKYEDAVKEAKRVAALEPNNSEAWKIAGFAETGLKQYKEAAVDLQKALDLQRASGPEDINTVDQLGRAYARNEEFELALPLLVKAIARTDVKPDPALYNLRGLSEYRTGKVDEALRSFNAAVTANPKDAASLYYLGRIFYERSELPAAIAALNRATAADLRFAPAWALLTTAYLRRAASTTGAGSDADYLSAVRAGESLTRVRSDAETVTLFAQALISAKQYVRAAAELEKVTGGADTKGSTLYLLGVSQSRAKNFPKAIAALERAAAKSPDDVNIYRELGYAYEVSKLYPKALGAYEKGAQLAPGDTDFKESIERVRPLAK